MLVRGIGLGESLFFIAAEAILAYAITAKPEDIDLTITGQILLGIGLFGLFIWLINSIVARWAVSSVDYSRATSR